MSVVHVCVSVNQNVSEGNHALLVTNTGCDFVVYSCELGHCLSDDFKLPFNRCA